MHRECGFKYSIPWCTSFRRKSRRNVAIVEDYHDGSGGRTLVHFQERKVLLKIDFMHAENMEEFLAGVDDGKVVVDIPL